MYRIIRIYDDESKPSRTIRAGLTLKEVQAHCSNPETSSRTATSAAARRITKRNGPWFDGYEEE